MDLKDSKDLDHSMSSNVKDSKDLDQSMSSNVKDPAALSTGSSKPTASLWEVPSMLSASGISSWARSLTVPRQSLQGNPQSENEGRSPLRRLTSGFGSLLVSNSPVKDENPEHATTAESSILGTLKKGMESSRTALKTVQDKAQQIVDQNKKLYQVGGFDWDLTYITENILVVGFPAGRISSGILGYFEVYRKCMEEMIKFFETNHKEKYKVYNLCSERLYDVSLFEEKVVSYPIDEHNCPSIQLIMSFCESVKSWLKQDTDNKVVIHSKAGLARTGLMVSSLLLYLRIFQTADESVDYYNKKRCVDLKALVIPSQIRYVKYFEHTLVDFKGQVQPARRCMLRGFRLQNCPYWVRPSITISMHNGVIFSSKKHPKTKDLMPEDFWFKSKQKGVMIFGLPGEPGVAELVGDFKIQFHDQQGDFCCWLNTTMIANRVILDASELDGFEKRKIPCPGFQVEIVLVDYDSSRISKHAKSDSSSAKRNNSRNKDDKDDVFSDSDTEHDSSSNNSRIQVSSDNVGVDSHDNLKSKVQHEEKTTKTDTPATVSSGDTEENALISGKKESSHVVPDGPATNYTAPSDFKPVAADASVFSFGDEEDYESE